MNVSTRQLTAFLHLARLQSFTKAAERMHITQAGLSAMMRDLETQFDCRLFDRTTRTVSLTLAGARLVPSVERMLAELGEVSLELGSISAHARHVLTVAVAPVVASSFFADVCEHFARSEPRVVVKLRDVAKPRILSMVESGEVDIGFCSQPEPASATERLALFKCQLLCVAQPGTLRLGKSRGAGIPVVQWNQLPKVDILALADSSQALTDTYLAQVGRAHEDRQVFESMPTLIAMAAQGFGIGIVPSFALPTCLRLGAEVARLRRPSVDVDFLRITRKGRELPRMADFFVQSVIAVGRTACAVTQ